MGICIKPPLLVNPPLLVVSSDVISFGIFPKDVALCLVSFGIFPKDAALVMVSFGIIPKDAAFGGAEEGGGEVVEGEWGKLENNLYFCGDKYI